MKSNTNQNQINNEVDPVLFKNWILSNYKLSPEGASDVVSRLKRIKKYVEIDAKSNPEKLITQIRHHKDFQKASAAVFSQLKNAIEKYKVFINKNKE
jgi:hypothetical protein